ncbi:MAG: type II toxin-antitoxin system RelE/ParE family toxin [Parvularculaceae bacterium]
MSQVWVSRQAAVDVAMVQESRMRAGAAAEAAALVELLESRLGILAERPQAGAPVPEISDTLRAHHCGGQIIYYAPSEGGQGIEVYRILPAGFQEALGP